MMRPPSAGVEVYLCLDPVDFRKQINGLAALVQDELSHDPFSEALFVFTNRRRDRVKILYWEASGFVLWMKRLERERFHWPRGEGETVTLSSASASTGRAARGRP
jgi:transposase